jgi:cell division protein FtsZ
VQATGTDGPFAHGAPIDYASSTVPAIVRKGRSATVEALANSGVDRYDIPAFLRKQAD